MFEILNDILSEHAGANLVVLHELAYETIRERTGLPARLVTLGLRDFATNKPVGAATRLPLDDKLFAVKGHQDLTIATLRGRVAVPFDIAGYSPGWDSIFPAYLTVTNDAAPAKGAGRDAELLVAEHAMLVGLREIQAGSQGGGSRGCRSQVCGQGELGPSRR